MLMAALYAALLLAAGSDLHRVSTSGARCDSDTIPSSSSSSSSSASAMSLFSLFLFQLLPSSAGSFTDTSRPLAPPVGRGETAHLAVAGIEDGGELCCGTDRHLVSKCAFFGSVTAADVSSSFSALSGGVPGESGSRRWYLHFPPDRPLPRAAHPRHSDRARAATAPPPLPPPAVGFLRAGKRLRSNALRKHCRGAPASPFPRGAAGSAGGFLFLIRTWPMQVTFGEEGSPSSAAATMVACVAAEERPTLLLQELTVQLDDPALRLRLRVPLPARIPGRPGDDGTFSRAGLDKTTAPACLIKVFLVQTQER